MEDFQKRNPNLYVFSAHLHMDEETPHVHIDFVPFIRNGKRGLEALNQIKQLKAKVTNQAEDIDFYKSKVHQQYVKLEQLQEKADAFERVKQYVGVDKIDIIVTNARELERIAQSEKQQNRAYGMGR